jgi:hypothetical protein
VYQDNNLAEAFKLRNLLGELQPEVTGGGHREGRTARDAV